MNADKWTADTFVSVDNAISALSSTLERSFAIRDSLYQDVLFGLSKGVDQSTKASAILTVANSINAHYGSDLTYERDGKVLAKEELEKMLSKELVEIVESFARGEEEDFQHEIVKLLFTASAYLPLEKCNRIFTTGLIGKIIRIAECTSPDFNRNMDLWTSSISIIRNVIPSVNMPNEFITRLIECINGHVHETCVQLCHILVIKVLFPKIKSMQDSGTFCGVLNSNPGFAIKVSRSIVDYLSSVLSSSKNPVLLSTACIALVSICEYSWGVDLVLNSGTLRKVVHLALVVANQKRSFSSYQKAGIYASIDEARTHTEQVIGTSPKTLEDLHELSFNALSVLSKMAFTSNHRQILAMLDNEIPEVLVKLLDCPDSTPKVKARSCNTLGNLGCETDNEVQHIIDSDAFYSLMHTFRSDIDLNTRIESAYAICACASKANRKQVGYIISCNSRTNDIGDGQCMMLLCDMLEFIERCDPSNESIVKLCKVVLNGLENILRAGVHEIKTYNLAGNPYIKMFADVQGDVRLARLCFFPEYNIARKAFGILNQHFDRPKIWNL